MATIRDLAKITNFSIATISRVLSNDPTFSVSQETRDAIFKAAESINYVYKPKRKGSTLRTIGCVMSVSFDYYFDPFFKSILNAVESNASYFGFDSVITLSYKEVVSHNSFIDNVLNQVDGLIIMETLPEEVIEYLKSKVKYIISIDIHYEGIPSIGYNVVEANLIAMRHLLYSGYENIAYVGGSIPNEDIYTSTRMMVYREALRQHNIEYKKEYIVDCEWNIDICAKETRRLLTEYPEIDAIFAGSDTLANAILGLLYDMNIDCPNDIGILGFNDNEGSSLSIPPLTTIHIPSHDIGKLALQVLSQSMEKGYIQNIDYTLPTHLVERASTKNNKD